MKNLFFSIALMLLLGCGCKQVVFWKNGIHSPREETPASLERFLEKIGLTSGNVYLFKDTAAFFHYLRHPVFQRRLFGLLVFNEQGLITGSKDTLTGQYAEAVEQIQRLQSDTVYPADSTFRWETLQMNLLPMKGTWKCQDQHPYDYLAVVTWAHFSGMLNEPLTRVVESAQKNRNAKIFLILLNVDMQKCWRIKKSQRLTIR